MAHNIATINGVSAMAYQGETPWHKLGVRLPSIRSIDQALDAANLRYEVGKVPLFLPDGTQAAGVYMNGRLNPDGTLAAQFGPVSAGFTNSSNEANAAHLQGLIDLGCTVESTAALGEGERVFMLLKLPEATIQPVPGDDIRGYFVSMWGHDGNLAVTDWVTGVRVVCQNTLNMAIGEAGGRHGKRWVKIQHRSNVAQRLDEAAALIKQATEVMLANGQTYRQLAERRMGPAELAAYIAGVIPSEGKDAHGNEKVSTVIQRRRDRIIELARTGRGADMANQLVSTQGGGVSLWAAVNAVTEYFDHVRPAEATSEAGVRMANDSALFGGNAQVKAEALTVARQLLGAAAVAA